MSNQNHYTAFPITIFFKLITEKHKTQTQICILYFECILMVDRKCLILISIFFGRQYACVCLLCVETQTTWNQFRFFFSIFNKVQLFYFRISCIIYGLFSSLLLSARWTTTTKIPMRFSILLFHFSFLWFISVVSACDKQTKKVSIKTLKWNRGKSSIHGYRK